MRANRWCETTGVAVAEAVFSNNYAALSLYESVCLSTNASFVRSFPDAGRSLPDAGRPVEVICTEGVAYKVVSRGV